MLVRHGVVGNISACHADARGSIPRVGGSFSFLFRCCRRPPDSAALAGRGHHHRGWVAERSKALVSGTSLFGGTGSNPVPITLQLVFIFILFLI